jgi:hypothetical protein
MKPDLDIYVIDTFNIFVLLRDKSLSGYTLEREIGVSRTTLLKVRSDKEQFQNLSVGTLLKIQKWMLSKNGKLYFSANANVYNLQTLEDLKKEDIDLYKQIDLEKISAFIKNPFIKTKLLDKGSGFSPMERSLFRRGEKILNNMTLKKVTKIQKLMNQVEEIGLEATMELYA